MPLKPKAKTYTVHQAKTHFSQLLKDAARGEEIIIARGHEPIAKLVSLHSPTPRQLGFARGILMISEDFDESLSPDWILGE